jgi:Family of unknown function (DUF6476)
MGGDTFEREAGFDASEERAPEDFPEPLRLKHLRWLVNALTITLIAGFLTIVIALVLRLTAEPPLPEVPAALSLPPGEEARAVTFGSGWVAVVTVDRGGGERIRVLDAATGAERGSLLIAAPE